MITGQDIVIFSNDSFAKLGMRYMIDSARLPKGVRVLEAGSDFNTKRTYFNSPILIVGENISNDINGVLMFLDLLRKVNVRCIFFICRKEFKMYFHRWGLFSGIPFRIFFRDVKAKQISRYIRYVIISGQFPDILPYDRMAEKNLCLTDLILFLARVNGRSWGYLKRKYGQYSKNKLGCRLKSGCLYLGLPRQIWLRLL